MPGAFTTDLTLINACEASTGWTKVGGANIATDGDAKVEGTNCLKQSLGTVSGATDAGYYLAATFDCTNQAIFMWRSWATPSNMRTKANQGVFLHILSDAAWTAPGTNYKRFYLDGSDTNATGGWQPFVVNPAATADASGGTLAVNSIDFIFPGFRQETALNITTFTNAFTDVIRRGTGLTVNDGTDGAPVTLSDIQVYDNANARAWGVLTKISEIFYCNGKIRVGTSGQSAVTRLIDTSKVLVYKDFPVGNDFYSFDITGNVTYSSILQFGNYSSGVTSNGCVIQGAGNARWNITASTYGHVKLYGCTLKALNAATLSGSSEMRGCAVSNSGTINVDGATIVGNTFSAHTIGTQLKIDSTSEITNVNNNTFNSSGTGGGHAIELTATGSYTFTNLTFNNYTGTQGTNSTASSGSTDAAIYNNSGGAVTITVDGGSNFSVRNGAGASTTVITGQVVLTLTGLVSGSDIVILTTGTTTELVNIDANSGSTYQYSYTYASNTYVDVCVYKAGYKPFATRNYLLGSTNASLPISQITDRDYLP